MKGLTPKQSAILEFIDEYISIHRYAPSYREIAEHFGYQSIASVFKHVKALVKKEALTSLPSSGRSMAVTRPRAKPEKTASEQELFLIGELSKNHSLETFAHTQSIEVPKNLVVSPENSYVIRIKGTGFQEAFLHDGDYIIVEAKSEAEEEETILAITSSDGPIIRILRKESGYLKLYSLDPQDPPLIMHPDDLSIYGTVVGMIRFYNRLLQG